MDRGAWWATVHGVAGSRTRLSDFTLTFHFHSLEKEMATHSSVLAWRTPGTGEPGGLPSMGSHGVGHDWSNLAAAAAAAASHFKITETQSLIPSPLQIALMSFCPSSSNRSGLPDSLIVLRDIDTGWAKLPGVLTFGHLFSSPHDTVIHCWGQRVRQGLLLLHSRGYLNNLYHCPLGCEWLCLSNSILHDF